MRCPTRLANDDGSVTIEAAFGTASLVIVAALIVSAMSALALYISAVDMAGAAARAHALGLSYQPQRGELTTSHDESWATATVRIDTPLMPISASAVYPRELADAAQ